MLQQHQHPHHLVFDAKSRRDPTGTASIRAAFRRAGDIRLQRVKNALRTSFTDHNVLGLKNGVASYASMTDMATRVRSFGSWFNNEAYRSLVERDAAWTRPFVTDAFTLGAKRAQQEAGIAAPVMVTPSRGRLGVYAELANTELSGIADAMVQCVGRMAANAVTTNKGCGPACRHCIQEINRRIRGRLHMMVNTLIVRAYNDAKLEQYAKHRVDRVGVIPETIKKPKPAMDALNVRELGLGSVEVLTADDDAVCNECQSLADEGPYLVEDVYGVLPLHPNCRCAWVPLGDPRLPA